MSKYLIDFKDTVNETEIQSYLDSNGCALIKNFKNLKNVYLVSSDIEPPVTDIVDIVVSDDATSCKLLETITVSHPPYNDTISLTVNEEKNWWKMFSLHDVDFTKETEEYPLYGQNTTVYLVDSGIDISHSEFLGKRVELLHSYTNNFVDTTGHGTALASLMVGNTCGMTDATVKVIKLFSKDTPTYQSDILTAFDIIMTDYINSGSGAGIVNLSWGIEKNNYIEQKLQNLINIGVIVVAAAGNNGTPIQNVTPASMTDVITIGAYNSDFLPCDFSNYSGPSDTSLTANSVNYGELDSWAPGENIYCALPAVIDPITGETVRPAGFGFTNGTSSAAAIYSAALAYNISQGLTDENKLLPHLIKDAGGVRWTIINSGDRVGLLDLSDPRYENSYNKICTYYNYARRSYSKNITLPQKIVARTFETKELPLFVLSNTESYEFLDPLPAGARMIHHYIYYTPPNEVVNETGVEVTTIRYRVNQLDGTLFTNTIDFVQIRSDFNTAELPADDPLIDIVAMDTCAGSSPGYCWGACPWAGYYCGTYSNGKTDFCDCRM